MKCQSFSSIELEYVRCAAASLDAGVCSARAQFPFSLVISDNLPSMSPRRVNLSSRLRAVDLNPLSMVLAHDEYRRSAAAPEREDVDDARAVLRNLDRDAQ